MSKCREEKRNGTNACARPYLYVGQLSCYSTPSWRSALWIRTWVWIALFRLGLGAKIPLFSSYSIEGATYCRSLLAKKLLVGYSVGWHRTRWLELHLLGRI